jgi:hypothetical protein
MAKLVKAQSRQEKRGKSRINSPPEGGIPVGIELPILKKGKIAA